MPLTVRWRLAIASAAVILAVLGAYAFMVRSYDASQLREQHMREDEDAARSLAASVAKAILIASRAGQTVATYSNEEVHPTASLTSIVEGFATYVWILDNTGRVIYTSTAIYNLPEANRGGVDSLVRSVRPSVAVVPDLVVGTATGPLPGDGVRSTTIQGLQFQLYGAFLGLGPASVNHVVAGRFATPLPAESTDVFTPLLLVIPILIMAAAGSAGVYERIALNPVDAQIDTVINNVEAITDGRSLHRRLVVGEESGERLARLTDTLNAMIARLETSFSGLRRFTADASHELKTPLTVMRAVVERAMNAQANRAEQLVALEEALIETTRMADLVESLLAFARFDEGRFELDREPVDLEAMAREVFETAVLLGESTDIEVKMNPPEPLTVPGDRVRLRQVFLNLVTNAIKYTPPKGHVELLLSQDEGFARFSVRDSGMGIAAADLPHVFERFWRADRARSRVGERGGFGLGLAISQYIVHAHGGSLTVKSRLGRGSTFTLALPLHDTGETAIEK